MAVWFIRDVDGYKGNAYNLSKAIRMYISEYSNYPEHIDVDVWFGGDDTVTIIHSEGPSRAEIEEIFDSIVETVATQDFALIRLSEIAARYPGENSKGEEQ